MNGWMIIVSVWMFIAEIRLMRLEMGLERISKTLSGKKEEK